MKRLASLLHLVGADVGMDSSMLAIDVIEYALHGRCFIVQIPQGRLKMQVA